MSTHERLGEAQRLAAIGSVSHGTLRSEDLVSAFVAKLLELDAEHPVATQIASFQQLNVTLQEVEYQEVLGEMVDELEEALQEFAPPYCYFGALESDGSDFGFWPDIDSMNDDNVLFFDDLSEAEKVFESNSPDQHFAIVNDHGNITLYRLKFAYEEVWAVV